MATTTLSLTGRFRLAPVTSRANWTAATELNVAPVSLRQQRILTFLVDYAAEYGYPPSWREVGAATGLRSLSGVGYHLSQLADLGLIELPELGTNRAIRLTWGMS